MWSLRDDRSVIVAAAGQCCFLIVPGWQGSGPGHWQSIWERKNRAFQRVEQSDWHNPRRSEWIRGIHNAIQIESKPVIIVAHSLGCIAVALWAEQANSAAQRVAGALLVAPPDLNQRTKLTAPLHDFAPMPQSSLPFPSSLIASENDPYMASRAARSLAAQWGSHFINAGLVGHINCASGFGDWPEGETYLIDLVRCGETGVLSPAH